MLPALKPSLITTLAACAAFYDARGHEPNLYDLKHCGTQSSVSRWVATLRNLGYLTTRPGVYSAKGMRSTTVTLKGRAYLSLLDATAYPTLALAQVTARRVYASGTLAIYEKRGMYTYSKLYHNAPEFPYAALDAWDAALPDGWRMVSWSLSRFWHPYRTPAERGVKKAA